MLVTDNQTDIQCYPLTRWVGSLTDRSYKGINRLQRSI